jgi:hypothetical protein
MGNRLVMLPLVVTAAGLGVTPLHALEVTVGASASVEYTDNARKSSDNEVSEMQERVSLDVAGTHAGETLKADFSYMVDRRFYNDESQDEDTRLEGFAALHWEQVREAVFWDFSHRRKDVLRDSALNDIRENRDERDVTEIAPTFMLRMSPVDSLEARLNYGMTIYREADELNSDRYGGSVSWRHLFSSIDYGMITLASNEIDFDSNRQSDYRYDAVSVAYSAQLARLGYTIRAGVNKAARDMGDDVTGPLINVNAVYNDGVNRWHALFDSSITDSSLGDGNRDIFDSIDQSDTSLGDVDIIKKTRAEAGVSRPWLCESCQVRATIYYDQEDYDHEPRDNDEYGADITVSYRISQSSDLSAKYRYRDVSYSGTNNLRSDYDQHELLFDYGYRVTEDLRVSVFAGVSDRSGSSDGVFGQDYSENRVGLRLSYDFL